MHRLCVCLSSVYVSEATTIRFCIIIIRALVHVWLKSGIIIITYPVVFARPMWLKVGCGEGRGEEATTGVAQETHAAGAAAARGATTCCVP